MWQSNAPWASSGYGQQSALFLPRLRELGHDIAVSCFYGLEGGMINWHGFQCYPTDQTRFGSMLLPDYAAHHAGGDKRNCLVMTLMDVWVMMNAMNLLKDMRFACWTPIDHDPCPPLVKQFLDESKARVIAMSKFGQRALSDAGFEPLYVPHGVDTSVYKPDPAWKIEGRERLGIPQDAFVVGMVANNQGLPSRKSFPQVMQAFKPFSEKHKDAILYLHSDIIGRNNGINLFELAKQVGVNLDQIRSTDQAALHIGIPSKDIAKLYTCFDVLANPSFGEGFGIPIVEAQACGIPVIVTDWTAMTELCGAGWLVGGERWYDATQGTFFKVPNVAEIQDALEQAYATAGSLAKKAVKFARQYDADRVTEKFWKPVMADITAPREIAPLRLAA